jgi:hypothetical protein
LEEALGIRTIEIMDDHSVNTPVSVSNGDGEHRWGKIIVQSAIALLLIAGVAYGYWYAQKGKTVPLEVAAGKIYITAIKNDRQTADIYAYDTTERALGKGSDAFEDGNFARYTSSLSKDSGNIAYFAAEIDEAAVTNAYPFKTVLNLISFPVADPDNWKVMTTGQEFLKLNPRWSPSGDAIAYNAFTGDFSKDPLTDINAWSVFISNQGGIVADVGVGSYPHWSSDGTQLLYEKTDGLYMYDVASGSSVQVMEFERAMSRAAQFSISPDGDMLVVSHEAENLTVYNIASWSPLTLEEVRTIEKEGSRFFEPTFSPDGRQIAVLEEVERSVANPPALHLSVFGAESGAYERLFDFASEFKSVPIFISDWR